MVKRTGGGDPLRTLPLLWRSTTKAGRSGLTLDAIVDAGIGLADEVGIEKLSMRMIAEALGVGTMSLYGHVPGRAELLDLMVDRVNAELYRDPVATSDPVEWRQRLRAVADANWQLLRRHRWLLGIDESRPPLGPGTFHKYDTELGALVDSGLSDVEIDRVLTLVLEHVKAAARTFFGAAEQQSAGNTDSQWWEGAQPLLAALVDPARFPLASRIGEAAGATYNAATDTEGMYTFGLDTILDGVEVLISRQRDGGPRSA